MAVDKLVTIIYRAKQSRVIIIRIPLFCLIFFELYHGPNNGLPVAIRPIHGGSEREELVTILTFTPSNFKNLPAQTEGNF